MSDSSNPQLPMQPDRQFMEEWNDIERLRERLLRVSAELANVRKRAARDVQEHQLYAEADLLRDLLPVVDALRHALDAAQIASDSSEMVRGVELIYQQLLQILEQHHCRALGVPGERFDPYRHEAVKKIHVPDEAPGIVIDVLQPGFQVHDRVLRPAKVIVSSEPT